MTIHVELCGRLADAVGVHIDIESDAGSDGAIHSIADLRDAIARRYPALAADMMSKRVHACLDDSIVPDTTLVGAGAVVAFFPPLSGG